MEIAAYCPLTRVIVNDTNGLLKTLRLPFDKLRENGGSIKTVGFYPFVVSLSNHSKYFVNSLLRSFHRDYRLHCLHIPRIILLRLLRCFHDLRDVLECPMIEQRFESIEPDFSITDMPVTVNV